MIDVMAEVMLPRIPPPMIPPDEDEGEGDAVRLSLVTEEGGSSLREAEEEGEGSTREEDSTSPSVEEEADEDVPSKVEVRVGIGAGAVTVSRREGEQDFSEERNVIKTYLSRANWQSSFRYRRCSLLDSRWQGPSRSW